MSITLRKTNKKFRIPYANNFKNISKQRKIKDITEKTLASVDPKYLAEKKKQRNMIKRLE